MATSILVRLDSAVEEQLNALALEQDKPVEVVAADVIASHFAARAQAESQIREGLTEFDGGFEGVPHDQVDAWLASWGSDKELAPPQ